MCDTVLVTREASRDGAMLLAKNSDREPSEAQALEVHDAASHAPDARVFATYVALPQVGRTRRVLLSRPHWMWGAEMGVNDAGVVVGNEAVFTRAPMQDTGLLGMDLVRLALERAGSARTAVQVIAELLETHGQGGPGGHRDKSFRYHNSFALLDRDEAWVLETADRAWVAARVEGVRAISNGLTLRDDWELGADGLAARARDAGLAPGKGKLDFARTFADRGMTWAAAARKRRACTEAFLLQRRGHIGVRDAMAALRQHGANDHPAASAGAVFGTVCAHASWWPTRRAGQTTASLVARVDGDDCTPFVTGTAAPCTSVFKPLWLDTGVPSGVGPAPGDRADDRSLWWRHERLHRAALGDLAAFLRAFAPERDAFEAQWVDRALNAATADASTRRSIGEQAFASADAFEAAWLRRVSPPKPLPRPLFARHWRRLDRSSGL